MNVAARRARGVVAPRSAALAAVRPNPRAIVVWSLAAVTVALLTNNPFYRGLVALAGLAVLQALASPGRRLRPLVLAACLAAVTATLMSLLTGHGGDHVLATLPGWLPLAGGPLTLESAAYGGAIGLGLVASLLAVAPLSFVLEPHEVVEAMPARLERTGIAVAASLNLVAGIGRTFAAIRDAQRMRGWRPAGLRSWNEVLVPVVLTAIEDSVLLAESMEARGFGAGGRTTFAASRWRAWDLAIVVAALAAALVILALRFGGATEDWLPYPSVGVPPLDPIAVLACLALALPALERR